MKRLAFVLTVAMGCRPSQAPSPPSSIPDDASTREAPTLAPQVPDAALEPAGPSPRSAHHAEAAARRESLCATSDHEACLAAYTNDCNAALDQRDDDEYEACTRLPELGAQFDVPAERELALRCIADRRLCPSKAACEHGDADACVEYGRREMARSPGSRDFKIVTDAYRKACKRKSAAGCRWLAFLYERGPEGMSDAIEANVPYDQKEALRLYRQACAWGDRKACEGVERIGKACESGGLCPERHRCVWIATSPPDDLE